MNGPSPPLSDDESEALDRLSLALYRRPWHAVTEPRAVLIRDALFEIMELRRRLEEVRRNQSESP